VAQIDKRI